MTNPSKVRFQSADHDALYANGEQKVEQYRLRIVTTNDPNGTVAAEELVGKAVAQPEGVEYALPMAGVLAQLPLDFQGFAFVRAENPVEVGAWGTGLAFLKTTAPAACNVTAFL